MTLTIPGVGDVDMTTVDAIHLRDDLTAALARELPGAAFVEDDDLRAFERWPELKPGDVGGFSLHGRDER